MQVEGTRSGIFKSSNRTREDQDRARKGEIYIRLANFKRSKRHTEVFRTSELLLSVY